MKTNRFVVVTGAAGGMGSLLVKRFLENGDTVLATDIKGDGLERLKGRLEAGDRMHTVVADVSDEAACAAVADTARKHGGRVDVLVNCAGDFPITPFKELTAKTWRRLVDVNLTGPFLMIKAVYPLMTGRGWGRIVNFGSASVYVGVASQAPYTTAKAGVVGLTRCLAREFGSEGITVNLVTPGLTSTPPVLENLPAEMRAAEVASRSIQREEQPEDLVGAAFFLASPGADFITGQTINVDGGKSMY
jgi:3-oxoacyl-[acyl-carrier protein] reductase